MEAQGGETTTSSHSLAEEKKQVSKMHTIGAPAKAKEFLSELVGAPKCMIQRKETTTKPIAVS